MAQASAAVAAMPPDLEIRARVETETVTIEQEGPITLTLRAEPGGTNVTVDRNQPSGARAYRNLVIDARVAAYLKQDADGTISPTVESSTGEQPQ